MLNLRMEKGTVLNIVQWTAQWLEAEKRVGIGSNLLSIIFFTGWYVWKARNEFIFNNLPLSPPATTSRITQAWIGDQHQHSGDISPIVECLTPALLGEQGWHPPPAGEFKINCDASFSTNRNIASATAILRDSKGRLVDGLVSSFSSSSAFAAEAHAVRMVALLAQACNLTSATIESHNQEVIKLGVLEMVPPWEILAYMLVICQLRLQGNLQLQWTPRVNNRADHWLANAHACNSLALD